MHFYGETRPGPTQAMPPNRSLICQNVVIARTGKQVLSGRADAILIARAGLMCCLNRRTQHERGLYATFDAAEPTSRTSLSQAMRARLKQEIETGIAPADFSCIRRAKLDRFTIDRLMAVLAGLGQEGRGDSQNPSAQGQGRRFGVAPVTENAAWGLRKSPEGRA